MKTKVALILTVLIGGIALVSFGTIKSKPSPDDNTPTMKNAYEKLWKQFDEKMENSLPESAEKILNDIESNARKENNQVQLLKTILYRQLVMRQTVEDNPTAAFITYAESQLDQLGTVEKAILQEEIARTYHQYLSENDYRISENLAIDGDLSKVEMKYWDKQTFLNLIDEYYAKALQPVEALKQAPTEQYLELYKEKYNTYYVEYEPTMFEFMFHRVASHYQETSTADDLDPEWNTDTWWLSDKEFVKANLGDSDNPIIKCLKDFQELIQYNLDRNEGLCLFNDYKRYQFVNEILDEPALFQDALRRLMQQYPNHEKYPELVNHLAQSLVQQYENNTGDSSYFDNYRKAAALCEDIIARFPKDTGGCKNTLDYIQQPQFWLNFNQVQLPEEATPAILDYRNLDALNYKIIPVKESELADLDKLYQDELLAALNKKTALTVETVALPKETDYLKHSTVIALPALKPGIYYLVAQKVALRFQVSNLGFITNKKEDCLEIVTLNRKTGHPEAGVTIQAQQRNWNYDKRRYETKTLATLTSDSEGKAVFDQKLGDEYFLITLRKGQNLLLPKEQFYVPTPSKNVNVFDETRLFTDRAIYRPGQTVYFKGIVVHHEGSRQSLSTNCSETMVFRDANYQEISRASFKTDEYGAFDGSFVIPTNLLNGVFRINGNHGSTTIRVEEYKRPTYEIHFETVKEQYKLNQEVTVKGSVDAYAGFGLDDVEYVYRVVRKTQFPWRCWWWWYPVVEDEQVAFGMGRTDETGKFAISFNLKPSLKTKPEQQPVFTYEIEVTATSAQGETHSSTHYIRAGYNEIAISTTLPSMVEQSEFNKYHIEVLNMNGSPAKSRISRKIYRYDDLDKILRRSREESRDVCRDLYEKKLVEIDEAYQHYLKASDEAEDYKPGIRMDQLESYYKNKA